MADKKTSLTIDITSDLACPWCYVALKRLENAIEQFRGSLEVHLRWHPYMIDMKTQAEGEDYLKYNRRRWGGDGWVQGMKDSAAQDGALFSNWGRQNPASVWANTFHAHRLLYLVQTRCSWRRMDRVKLRLFDEYYEKGVNISGVDELIRIGLGCELSVRRDEDVEWEGGVTDDELERWMRSARDGHSELLAEDSAAKRRGISGVPYFELPSGLTVNGAQTTKHWVKIFRQVLG